MKRATKKKVSRKKPRMPDLEARLASLPKTITFSREGVAFDFSSKMEFLESMAKLTGAIDNDFDEFLARFPPDPGAPANLELLREQFRNLTDIYRELRQKEANRDKNVN